MPTRLGGAADGRRGKPAACDDRWRNHTRRVGVEVAESEMKVG